MRREEVDPLTQATWRKSTRSAQSDHCVEVAFTEEIIGIRDSKAVDGGTLRVRREVFADFIESVKSGKFDL